MKNTYSDAQQAEGKIKIALARLAGRYPFHARVLEQLTVTAMPAVETMGVTVRNGELLLVYNPKFVVQTPAAELGGVLLHEVHHVALGHVTADPKDFDDRWARTVAEEVTVNEFVAEPLPAGAITLALFPALPRLESTDQRYERLKRMRRRIPISGPGQGESIQGGTSGKCRADSTGTGGSKAESDSPGTAQAEHGGSPQPGQANQPGAGRVIDNHDVWREAVKDPQAVDLIRDVLQQAALDAGIAGLEGPLRDAAGGWGLGLGIGTEPDDGQCHLSSDRDGRLDWRHALRRYIGRELEPKAVLTRPPRRFPELVGIVPGRSRRARRPRIMAVIDTSGSISDETLEMIDGELRRLATDHEVITVECDVAVHKVAKYRRLESVAGRGGTDFRPPLVADFLRKHRADLVIYFTDGFGPAPARPPVVPVIWCLVPAGERPAPWGRVVQMSGGQDV